MKRARYQALPASGCERETLRNKGQFWTPDWVAEFMVAYALREHPKQMLDPALGEGVFFRAAKRYSKLHEFDLTLFGRDIDPTIFAQARQSGLTDSDLRNVEIRDFVLDPPSEKFPAIVANPPYIRHHRLSSSQKASLRDFARKATGKNIDGRAGLTAPIARSSRTCRRSCKVCRAEWRTSIAVLLILSPIPHNRVRASL